MNASVEATAIADSGPELSVLSWCAGEIRQSLQTAGESLHRQLQAGPDDTSALRAAVRMASLISFVMCGITWTVRPR